MTTITTTQFDRFLRAAQTLLPPAATWPQLNTYPNSLAEATIDAIWSERVRYTNVVEVVDRYRAFRRAQGADADTDGARELEATFAMGVEAWIERIGNHQRVFSRDVAPYKAEVVHQAAQVAVAAGVESARELAEAYAENGDRFKDLRQRWLALPSQHSGMSFGRLLLAAGIETVPLDPWLVEFTSGAIGAPATAEDAIGLVTAAAKVMDVTPFRLRNAIWLYQTKLDHRQHRSPGYSAGVAAPPT
ncbi:MAG: hypothetical protein LBD77_11535 [Bifidobacteriaceae bacterium]|jgi:hypothetical protein|nr:hypothetical protein [Bifidobacteriaceae bacterium]